MGQATFVENARRAKNREQREAAAALGIARQTYAKYESNPERISLGTWAKMLSLTDVFDSAILDQGLRNSFYLP